MLIAQISDPHVTVDGTSVRQLVDTPQRLRDAFDTLAALPQVPDVILFTGDLVNDGTVEEYDLLAEILEHAPAPILPVPGNHDNRSHFHQLFAGLGVFNPNGPCHFVVDAQDLQLIGLDTTKPGFHDGEVSEQAADWLDETLTTSDRPAIIFMHHVPYPTGAWWFDYGGVDGADRFRDVLDRHDHVLRVVSGHVHRATQTNWGNTILSSAPSTAYTCDIGVENAPAGLHDAPGQIPLFDWDGERLLAFSTDLPGEHVHVPMATLIDDFEAYTAAAKAGGPMPKER